ncbi:MAG: hypothetical protein Roseis2KO_42660 [Roseivirga sp.]
MSIAESNAQYGAQAGVMAPSGSWSNFWGTGFGGQVYYKRDQGDNIAYGGSIGFFSLPGQTVNFGLISAEYADASIIPILGTFDYKLDEMFYAGGDVGYNVFSVGDLDQSITSTVGSSFAVIPKVGANFGMFNAEARFNIVGDSYLSLLVGISLGGSSN